MARRDAALSAVASLSQDIPGCERIVDALGTPMTCIQRGDEHCRPCHARFFATSAADSIRTGAEIVAEIENAR